MEITAFSNREVLYNKHKLAKVQNNWHKGAVLTKFIG